MSVRTSRIAVLALLGVATLTGTLVWRSVSSESAPIGTDDFFAGQEAPPPAPPAGDDKAIDVAARSTVDESKPTDDEPEVVRRKVRIVDGRTRAPIADAKIRIATRGKMRAIFEARQEDDPFYDPGPEPYCFVRHCAKHGSQHRSDAAGELEIVHDLHHDEGIEVVVEKGHLRGSESLTEENLYADDAGEESTLRVVEIAMRPSGDHWIEVVDATLAPAPNVPFAIYKLNRAQADAFDDPAHYDPEGDWDRREASPFTHADTDANGVLNLQWPSHIVRDHEREDPHAEDEEKLAAFLVVPRIPFRRPPALKLPLHGTRLKKHRLVLPPAAPLEFRIERPDRSPVVLPGRTEIIAEESEFRHGRLAISIDKAIDGTKLFGSDERVLFPLVGLGTKIYAEFTLEYQGYSAHRTLSGPTSAVGTTKRTLRFPQHTAFFDVRVDDTQGRIANPVRLVLQDSTRVLLNGAWKASPDGRLHFAAMMRRQPATQAHVTFRHDTDANRRAILESVDVRAGKSHDLGRVRLAKHTSWITGHCRDTAGKPLGGIHIQIVRRVRKIRGTEVKPTHTRIWGLKTRTNKDGAFRIPFVPSPGQLFVMAWFPMFESNYVQIRGAGHHDITLHRRGHFDIRWQNLPTCMKRVQIQASQLDVKPWDNRMYRRYSKSVKDGTAHYQIGPILPGRWKLEFTSPMLVGRIEKTVLLEEGTTADVNFDGATLKTYDFEVEGKNRQGRRFKPRIEWRRDREALFRGTKLSFRNGKAAFCSTERTLEIEFLHPGYATLHGTWGPGQHRLRFAPARRVTFEFADPHGVLRTAKWRLDAEPVDNSDIPSNRASTRRYYERHRTFIRDGKATVELRSPRPYAFYLRPGQLRRRPVPVPSRVGGIGDASRPPTVRIRLDGTLIQGVSRRSNTGR